jgi:hypothetical protein
MYEVWQEKQARLANEAQAAGPAVELFTPSPPPPPPSVKLTMAEVMHYVSQGLPVPGLHVRGCLCLCVCVSVCFMFSARLEQALELLRLQWPRTRFLVAEACC